MVGRYLALLVGCCFSGIGVKTKSIEITLPRFAEEPKWPQQDYYDEDGPPIRLDCKIVADRSVKILWFKDGSPVSKGMKSWYISNDNQTLTLDPPKAFQTGQYCCLVSNSAGTISHNGSIVIVERTETTRPRVIGTDPPSRVVHAAVGGNITLSCVFDIGGSEISLLDLEMDWQKNHTEVNDTDHTTWNYANTRDYNQVFYLNITNLQTSDYGDYECIGRNSAGNDSRVLSVLPPKPNSGPDHTLIIVFSCVGGVCLVGVVAMVTTVTWYRRKHAASKYESFDWPSPDVDHYDVPNLPLEHDVFVSYSSEDQDWVFNSLFQTMTSSNYEVCIDFKDFTPGMAISENILEAIYKSRKVIVVLSQNFMKSMWGQFELSHALNRAVIQRKDVLIIIRYDSCKVPAKLMGKTFLDWNSSDVRPHFWKRLFESVGEPGYYGNKRSEENFTNNNRDSEKQDSSESFSQNGSVSFSQSSSECENQNGSVSEHQNGKNSAEQNHSEKNEVDSENGTIVSETDMRSASSYDYDNDISYSEDGFKSIKRKMDSEMKRSFDHESCTSGPDRDSCRLIENDSDIIDIHQSVVNA